MATSDPPAWIAAATAAAVRLAAEAGAEVDDALGHGDASGELLAQQVVRLRQSAEITEVAADLAALLWAECEDVPPIATILEEPETQAALHAVAEARRQGATRLAGGEAPQPTRLPQGPHATGPIEDLDWSAPAAVEASALPTPAEVTSNPTPEPAALVPLVAAPSLAVAPGAVPVRRTGAVVAGAAAAAIVLFGRKLRRA